MKTIRRVFGVLDTSLSISILLVAGYWLQYVLESRYVRVLDKNLELYHKELTIAIWLIIVAISIIMLIVKMQVLKKKKSKVNILWFIGTIVIFTASIMLFISLECNKYEVIEILKNKI